MGSGYLLYLAWRIATPPPPELRRRIFNGVIGALTAACVIFILG